MRKLLILAGLLPLCSLNAVAQLSQIIQISPAPNTTAAVVSANTSLTLDTDSAFTTANIKDIRTVNIFFSPIHGYPFNDEDLTGITAGDINNDGCIDIIQATNTKIQKIVNNNGVFEKSDIVTTVKGLRLVPILFDPDEDGDLDFTIFNSDIDQTKYYKNDGKGHFEDYGKEITYLGYAIIVSGKMKYPGPRKTIPMSTRFTVDNNFASIYHIDINNDGYFDDLYFGQESGILILDKNGYTNRKIPFWKETETFNVGDFNGDGKIDVTHASKGYIYISLNNGDCTFSNPQKIGCYEGIATVGGLFTVDINGDNKLDILVAGTSKDPKVYLNSVSEDIQLSTSTVYFPGTSINTHTTTSISLSFGSHSQDVILTSHSTTFSISLDNTTFGSTVVATPDDLNTRTVYIRFTPTTIGTCSSTISIDLGCSSRHLNILGNAFSDSR